MSVSNDNNLSIESLPTEPSKFGKRLGWAVCLALILFAALVAIITFSGSDSQSAAEPVQSSNPFK